MSGDNDLKENLWIGWSAPKSINIHIILNGWEDQLLNIQMIW